MKKNNCWNSDNYGNDRKEARILEDVDSDGVSDLDADMICRDFTNRK